MPDGHTLTIIYYVTRIPKERFQSSTTLGITFNTFIATIEGLYEQGI